MTIEREIRMIDVTSAEDVQVQISNDFLWINIDGRCLLRAYIAGSTEFVLDDERTKK